MISGPSCFCLQKISYAIAEENKFSYCTQLHVIKTSFKHNIYSKAKVKKKNPNHQIIEIVFWTFKKKIWNLFTSHTKKE